MANTMFLRHENTLEQRPNPARIEMPVVIRRKDEKRLRYLLDPASECVVGPGRYSGAPQSSALHRALTT